MTANTAPPPNAILLDEAQAALAKCREVLNGQFAGFDRWLPLAPRGPNEWFDFLHGIPQKKRPTILLRRMASAVKAPGSPWPATSFERYVLLQAFLASLPAIPSLPVEASVKRLFFAACLQVASTDKRWQGHFGLDSSAFAEMAKVATLRRLPAGQLAFDTTKLPESWLLKVHPSALPGLIGELAAGMGGLGPFLSPHLYSARPNALFILKTENERSFWRIAKTMELQPNIKGMMADSWFYSAEVGDIFPHLAWLRDFFVEQGAYLVDMEPADPESGFLVGSAKRRQLYEQRQFRPRRTLVLWRRADVLAWAAAHPELGEPTSPSGAPRATHAAPPAPPDAARPASPPALAGRRPFLPASGRFTVVDAVCFLNKRPKLYFLFALIAPALSAAVTAALMFGRFSAAPAFIATFTMMWLVQYVFLQ